MDKTSDFLQYMQSQKQEETRKKNITMLSIGGVVILVAGIIIFVLHKRKK